MPTSIQSLRSGSPTIVDPKLYSAYAQAKWHALTHLEFYYHQNANGGTSEADSMEFFVRKLIETTKALELKHRYNKSQAGRPTVAASGFSFTYDIRDLAADLSTAGERLPKLPSIDYCREKLLDNLMSAQPDPATHAGVDRTRHDEERDRLQWQIAEHAYLSSLDLRRQFFYFTPGKLFPVQKEEWKGEEKGRRAYRFSWGCWDPETHRPCVYFLLFTQAEHEAALEQESPDYVQFLRAVEQAGSRAPKELEIVFAQLDELTSRFIHPKALKRVIFGPLVTPILYRGREGAEVPLLASKLMPVFEEAGVDDMESVLFFSTQFMFSYGERTPTGSLASKIFGSEEPKTRQLFVIPKTDQPLQLQRYALLPHRLRQHISDELVAATPELQGVEFLAYNADHKEVNRV